MYSEAWRLIFLQPACSGRDEITKNTNLLFLVFGIALCLLLRWVFEGAGGALEDGKISRSNADLSCRLC